MLVLAPRPHPLQVGLATTTDGAPRKVSNGAEASSLLLKSKGCMLMFTNTIPPHATGYKNFFAKATLLDFLTNHKIKFPATTPGYTVCVRAQI